MMLAFKNSNSKSAQVTTTAMSIINMEENVDSRNSQGAQIQANPDEQSICMYFLNATPSQLSP